MDGSGPRPVVLPAIHPVTLLRQVHGALILRLLIHPVTAIRVVLLLHYIPPTYPLMARTGPGTFSGPSRVPRTGSGSVIFDHGLYDVGSQVFGGTPLDAGEQDGSYHRGSHRPYIKTLPFHRGKRDNPLYW